MYYGFAIRGNTSQSISVNFVLFENEPQELKLHCHSVLVHQFVSPI